MRHIDTPATTQGSKSRRGFTLVELLVVIAIIGMLVALLIPAVGAARATMRKATCLNNMREIGTALINFETSKQRYPGYLEPLKAVTDVGPRYLEWRPGPTDQQYVGSVFRVIDSGNNSLSRANQLRSRVSWATHILPEIDRNDLWDVLMAGGANEAQRRIPRIELYVCPDDTDVTSADGSAGLSYSVNTGGWDFRNDVYLSGSGQGDVKENGMFFNMVDAPNPIKQRLSGIQDGAATTIMLSENMHKNPTYSWFGVQDGNPGEAQFGMVWVANLQPSSNCTNNRDQARFNFEPDALNFSETAPCYARPYSRHSGNSFNVIFADHHGTSLNPDLDYVVYQQLLTSHGRKCLDPADHTTAGSDPILTFRTAPPLSQSDFD